MIICFRMDIYLLNCPYFLLIIINVNPLVKMIGFNLKLTKIAFQTCLQDPISHSFSNFSSVFTLRTKCAVHSEQLVSPVQNV